MLEKWGAEHVIFHCSRRNVLTDATKWVRQVLNGRLRAVVTLCRELCALSSTLLVTPMKCRTIME